jgi:hypothetical protein
VRLVQEMWQRLEPYVLSGVPVGDEVVM